MVRKVDYYDYRDKKGNKLKANEWRRINKIKTPKFKSRVITIVLPLEYYDIFHKIRKKHKLYKDDLVEKIIVKYLKGRLQNEQREKEKN